ncbi:MAG: hypothetical protein SP1CHLAM54_10790 [Chlamydiia bacterium]|nr:hypothetical protein [Chlamydiia bacterium]MCH9615984.1 hypothetical protein [Chlamydiia bacterium]MCH9629007.1 hypothetical protein [Chlamydiia bacterium]
MATVHAIDNYKVISAGLDRVEAEQDASKAVKLLNRVFEKFVVYDHMNEVGHDGQDLVDRYIAQVGRIDENLGAFAKLQYMRTRSQKEAINAAIESGKTPSVSYLYSLTTEAMDYIKAVPTRLSKLYMPPPSMPLVGAPFSFFPPARSDTSPIAVNMG